MFPGHDEFENRSESEIDGECEEMAKLAAELELSIRAEETKIENLDKGYGEIKDKVLCQRVPKMRKLIEEATADCLKDCKSNTDTSNFRARFMAVFNRRENSPSNK